MAAEGFLVVRRLAERPYRGLYRTPSFDQEAYDLGFDDPYITGEFVDDFGLIAGHSLAAVVLTRFAEQFPRAELEVIRVKRLNEENDSNADSPTRLGYDVAEDAPFWSVVIDMPPKLRDVWKPKLNAHELFPSADRARRYLTAYRDTVPDDSDIDLHIWEVHLA